MIQERTLDEVYRAIGTGVLADKAIIALARFQRFGLVGLSDSDRQALELVRQYLASASEGTAVTDKKRLSTHSLERALALDETTEAASLRVPGVRTTLQAGLTQYLQELVQTLDSFSEGGVPPQEEVGELRGFLGSLSRHTLNKVAMKLMPDVQPEGHPQ